MVNVQVLPAASFVLGFKAGRTHFFWQRLTSVHDIPSNFFGPTAPMLRGTVVSVIDRDTVRFLHTPTFFHSSHIPPQQRENESSSSVTTLPIRLCTIDAPETAKFGKTGGQPFGNEAKEKLCSLTIHKTVYIRLRRRDQYGRVVAENRTGMIWSFYTYLDEQMHTHYIPNTNTHKLSIVVVVPLLTVR